MKRFAAGFLMALVLPAIAKAQTILECRLDGDAQPYYLRINPTAQTWEDFDEKAWAWQAVQCKAADEWLEGLSKCRVTVTDEVYAYENKAADLGSIGFVSESRVTTIDRRTGRYSWKYVSRRELIGATPTGMERSREGACIRSTVDPATRPKPGPKL